VTKWMRVGVVLLAAAVVAGCGAGPSTTRQASHQQPTIRGTSFPQQLEPASQVSVYEDDYHGWRALFMKNGLVTVVAVPAIGGRIMEYKLGSHPFLWVNEAELKGEAGVDDDGNIYVSDKNEDGGALKFDNDGNFIIKIGKIGEGENMTRQAGYLAVNSKLHKLYIADDPNGQVDVYDSVTGNFLYEFGGHGEGPDKWGDDCEGIAIGPWDLVFAVDENGGTIKVFREDYEYF